MATQMPMIEYGAGLREDLIDNLARTPHAFIREPAGFLRADKQLYADLMLRPLPLTDDLRFVYDDQLAALGERLAWDSRFFGYEVARLHGIFPLNPLALDYTQVLRQWLDEVYRRGIRYLFVAVHAEDLALMRALSACGFALIETRVIYHRSLKRYHRANRFPVRFATDDDIPSLGETARSAVNIYDRFHADPFIAPADADRLMVKWVEASIKEGFADFTLVPDMTNPAAFITVRYLRQQWAAWGLNLSQMVLVAAAPSCKGWFAKLASEVCYLLRESDSEHVFITTQLTNRALIHSCEKLGFRFGRGEHIFRIIL
jgi:dTDP-4-amino-4,6-dideoxy-D-galactose acyltransferase